MSQDFDALLATRFGGLANSWNADREAARPAAILVGSGSPEGVLAAPVGSFYQRTDGAAGTAIYVKETGTGNTGWSRLDKAFYRSVDSFKLAVDADDTNAFNAAFAWSASTGYPVYGTPNKQYTVSATLNFDQRNAHFNAMGCHITFTHDGVAIQLGFPNSGNVFYGLLKGGICNLRMQGPGKSSPNAIGIAFSLAGSTTSYSEFMSLDGIYITSFYDGLRFYNNTWAHTITRTSIHGCTYVGRMLYPLVNAGERMTFNHCNFFNSDYGFEIGSAGAYFHDCSFDYMALGPMLKANYAGHIETTHCHFENKNENDGFSWFVTEDGGSITVDQFEIAMTGSNGSTRTSPIGLAQGASGAQINFGVGKFTHTVRDSSGNYAGWLSYLPDYIVDGKGVPFRNAYYMPTAPVTPSHRVSNLIGDSGFALGYLTDFVDNGTDPNSTTFSTTAGDFVTGTTGLKLAPASGKISRLDLLFNVDPNTQFNLKLVWKLFGATTDKAFITCQFYSEHGIMVGGPWDAARSAASLAAFTPEIYQTYWAPTAARYLRVSIGKGTLTSGIAGASDGVGYLAVDRVVVTGTPGMTFVARGSRPPPLWCRNAVNIAIPVSVGHTIGVSTDTAAVSLKLPSNPVQGDKVTFYDAVGSFGTNALTILRNGKTIRNQTADMVFSSPWTTINFIYSGSTWLYNIETQIASSSQSAASTGQGGAVNTGVPRIWKRDQSFVMIGDRESVQEDINFAAYSGRTLVGDPTATLNPTVPINLPANIRAELRQMRIAGGGLTSGPAVTVSGQLGSSDIGSIKGLRIQFATVSNHVDTTKNVDGLKIGSDLTSSAEYIRQLKFEDLTIIGPKTAISIYGSNSFLLSFVDFNVQKFWDKGFAAYSQLNSGERIALINGTIGDGMNLYSNNAPASGFYTDTAASNFEWCLNNVSVDYCDRVATLYRGRFVADKMCHFEDNSNHAMFDIYRTGAQMPVFLDIDGEIITGPGFTSWHGIPKAGASGRPAIIRTTGAGHNIKVGGKIGNYALMRNTQIVMSSDGAALGTLDIKPMTDAGYDDGASGPALGKGAPNAISYSKNRLYRPPSGTTGWTTFTGVSADTTKFLPGETQSFKLNETSATSGQMVQQFNTREGETWVGEMWVHIEAYTAGSVKPRVNMFVDAAASIAATGFPITTIQGLGAVSPVSASSATITIPDALHPSIGIFTPGTMAQGTFAVGDRLAGLSGAGITDLCYILDDPTTDTSLAAGTFKVYIKQAAAVSAQTIIGFRRLSYRVQVPNGTQVGQFSIFANAFQGVAYICGERFWTY